MPRVGKADGYIAVCILCCVRCVSAYKAWHGQAINNAPTFRDQWSEKYSDAQLSIQTKRYKTRLIGKNYKFISKKII